jgi:hypothetical protein
VLILHIWSGRRSDVAPIKRQPQRTDLADNSREL